MRLHSPSRLLPFLLLPALAAPACVETDDGDEAVADDVDVATETTELLYAPAADGFAPADFDGDGKADPSWRDAYWGTYYLDNDDDYRWDWSVNYTYGSGTPRFLVPADYDGDGRDDVAIKDSAGVWNIDYAANGFASVSQPGWDANLPGYGATSLPVPADYDGDGRIDISVKDSGGTWYINYASNGFAAGWDASWGGYGPDSAVPVPADYDGDGRADLGVKDSYGYWHINYASNGFAAGWDVSYPGYGGSTARPAPADYDGDGRADLSVKDSGGTWYINYASNGFAAGWDASYAGYGSASFPVPADYDGDGKADLSIGHGGDWWYYDFASNGFGSWDVIDRIRKPGQPSVELVEATVSSLKVRVTGDNQTESLYWYGEWDNAPVRDIPGKTDTFTFTGLASGTEYCFYIQALNSEGFGSRSPCFTTKTPPAPEPTSGTATVWLDRVGVDGPISFSGTWGPVPGAVATRLWLADEPWGAVTIYRFLKPGYSNLDCNRPEATIPLIDGGSLDASQIAELQGITLPPGNTYYFTACFSTTKPNWDPNTITFNLDWQK